MFLGSRLPGHLRTGTNLTGNRAYRKGWYQDEHGELADFHDKSLSRGQKLSWRATEERVVQTLSGPSARFVPLGGGSYLV